jgi:hypothetical protein
MTDLIIAAIAALVLTFADRWWVSGPYMGLAGIVLSLAAAIAGWYVAKAAARLTARDPASGYSAMPLAGFTLFGAIIFGAAAYVKLFDLTKADYTGADVAFHLLLVGLAAFVLKMAITSVNRISG